MCGRFDDGNGVGVTDGKRRALLGGHGIQIPHEVNHMPAPSRCRIGGYGTRMVKLVIGQVEGAIPFLVSERFARGYASRAIS